MLKSRNLILEFTWQRLLAPEVWITSIVVGSFINLYGQLLVPWLRGTDPVEAFTTELANAPGVTALSIGMCYLFPLAVGLFSSVSTRYALRQNESLAAFPDRKPDPVFRADPDGQIVEAGETTQDLFSAHTIKRAADILGADVWSAVLSADRSGAQVDGGVTVHFKPEDQWYLVSHSPAADGHINIYLTGVTDDVAQCASRPANG